MSNFQNLVKSLFVRPPVAIIDVPGMPDKVQLRVHSRSEHVSKKLLDVCQWEPTETKCVRTLLKTPGFIIDVGANLGYYTVVFGRLLAEHGTLIALEPDKRNFELLSDNVVRNHIDNVKLINCAAGSCIGTAYIQRSTSNYGDHRVFDSAPDGAESVPTLTLDSLIVGEECRPDFVKIDCQGSEVSVLKGLSRSLSSEDLRPKAMVIEIWPFGLKQAGNTIVDLLNQIPLEHFKMWDIGRWKGIPVEISSDQLLDKCKLELTVESELFTNIILIDRREVSMIERMLSFSDHYSL